MAFSLEPVHANPDLVEDTISLLKEEWPNCLAERLHLIETPQCTGLPCSLIMVETRGGAATTKEVVGHLRVCEVVGDENRVYVESVVIQKSRRNSGLGKKMHQLLEDYARRCLKVRYIQLSCQHQETADFYKHLKYSPRATLLPVIAANICRTYPGIRYKGLVVPQEWEHFYESEKGLEPSPSNIQRFVMDLDKSCTSE
ncbi:N-alpha-acetyltransferase 80-like [Asterias amurensis]|uniref:N-alpha-acetyltransferase 80-like n=1 Tax=Asterias amurensis TaxID=7602 RepID=UPI003AB54598